MATSARLVGLDVARALALLGMVTTHVLPDATIAGDQTWYHDLAAGRASALFAVLAGVTLALSSGGPAPVTGRLRLVVTGGLAARAVLIALLGLALGGLDSGLAVILTYYGVLFLLGLAFLGLRARSLALLAAGWLVAAPLVSHWVRPVLPAPRFDNPSFAQLDQPGLLLSELLLTGYYPVLPWLAYLLAGMALGRSDLARRAVQAGLLVGGALLAVAAGWLSAILVADRWDQTTLDYASYGLNGTTPAGGRLDWLLLAAPHSGTPFDLAETIGSGVAVIGLCLLLVGLWAEEDVRWVAVPFGAGTVTLTLYSLHVVMKTEPVWPPEEPWSMSYHVVILGSIGMLFAGIRRRGPLESLVGLPGRLLRRWTGTGNPAGRSPVRST